MDSTHIAQFEKSSDQIVKYFSTKYGSNLNLIKNLQQQRRNLETPIIQARRALQTIKDSDSMPSRRCTSKQSERMKVTSTSFLTSTMRPQSYGDSFYIHNNTFLRGQMDVSAALVYIQNLQSIHICLTEHQQIPNFQSYWESVYEFKQEQYLHLIRKQSTKIEITKSIILNDICISFIQCYLKELFMRNLMNKTCQELNVIVKLLVENFALFMRKMLSYFKSRNNIVDKLNEKIELVLRRTICNVNYIQDIKKNNSFITTLIESLLKFNNPAIQPVIITCRHCLEHHHQMEPLEVRKQLVNAIFLCTQQQSQDQQESPLKSLFRQPSQQMFSQHLKETFSTLEQVKPPYLPPDPIHPFTLVLDLDETLGHFNEKSGKFDPRPRVIEFLNKVQQYYEIVIFTAGLQGYAEVAIDQLNCREYIQHMLYRQHTTLLEHGYVKDLSKLGRDLSRVIIVDNTMTNFSLQPNNALLVSTWTNQQDDLELDQLGTLLVKVARCGSTDVRKSLRKYRDYISRFQKQ